MKMEPEVPLADTGLLRLLVRQVRYEGQGIHSYELVDPKGGWLPEVEAGAHIDIHLPDGMVRQYSLSQPPEDRTRYVIAVLRDTRGRGGSAAVHDQLHVQDIVQVSQPRNHFRLAPNATKALLLAGGIGVTPLKAMAHALEARGVDFEMHYCAKDPGCTAFTPEMAAWQRAGRLHYHFDGGDPQAGLDIQALLADPAEGTHLYYCGPPGFMAACTGAASHWPAGSVHFEYFKAPVQDAGCAPATIDEEAGSGAAQGFVVELARSGQKVDVGPEQSIVDALADAGVTVETSCSAGLCATCKVRYLAGEPLHNDYILGDDEHREYITLCVSRAKAGETLVLDL